MSELVLLRRQNGRSHIVHRQLAIPAFLTHFPHEKLSISFFSELQALRVPPIRSNQISVTSLVISWLLPKQKRRGAVWSGRVDESNIREAQKVVKLD